MKGIFAAFFAESLKIRRSKILWISTLSFLIIGVMIGFLMFLAKNPELAQQLGLLGTKASILELETDWPTYFEFLYIVISMGGLLGFGFLTSWVFGREYSDRTIKDLLALPVSRSRIVLAKFLVIFIWCIFLSIITVGMGLISGNLISLSGGSAELLLQGIYTCVGTSLLTILLCTPVAFFASYGRGYLPPIAFVIFTMALTQFIGILGLAPYFPWAIPVLFSGAGASENASLGIMSYFILILTSFLGIVGTYLWWRFADQT